MDMQAAGDMRTGPVIVLGGLPGAGKSTALRRLAESEPAALVLDPEQVHRAIAGALPWLRYGAYRWLCHAVHRLRVVHGLRWSDRPVLIHSPANRGATRGVIARLAARLGREAHLIYLDTAPDQAVVGQLIRGRVLPQHSFAEHCRRAEALWPGLVAGVLPNEPWSSIEITDRERVIDRVRSRLHRPAPVG